MKVCLFIALVLSAFLTMPVVFVSCEQSHTETTKDNLFGGQTREETTVRQNPITGETSVEHEKQVTH